MNLKTPLKPFIVRLKEWLIDFNDELLLES